MRDRRWRRLPSRFLFSLSSLDLSLTPILLPQLSGRQQGRDLERDYFKPSREQEDRGARFADAVGLSEGRRGGGRLAGRLELDAQRHHPYSRPSSARRDVEGGGFRRERRGGGGGSGGFRGRGRDGGGSNGQRERNKRSTPEDLDKAMDSYWNSVPAPCSHPRAHIICCCTLCKPARLIWWSSLMRLYANLCCVVRVQDDAEGRDETSTAGKATAADDTETKGRSD